MAEKYPALSPYSYAANNPVIYVDPDGNKIILGSTFDRVLNFFGYKTKSLKYVETAAARLKQSETGLSLYNELDAIEQEIVVQVAELGETPAGEIKLGETQPEGDVGSSEFTGATVKLDPENIEKNAVEWGIENPQDAPAITLGHELGHVKAAKDNLKKYTEEVKSGTAEQQAVPFENKIREELKNLLNQDDEENRE